MLAVCLTVPLALYTDLHLDVAILFLLVCLNLATKIGKTY